MYDIVEIRDAHNSLWEGLARHFRNQGIDDVPGRLVHDRPVNFLWSDDRLFMSQCCGYDIVHQYKNQLQVLATPCFDAPGCSNGNYSSAIIVPSDSSYDDVIDMTMKVAVVNGPESHSGMNALFSLVAPHSEDNKFFAEVIVSGGHSESLAMMVAGKADVAAVDCVTYELLRRYRPEAIEGTRRLGLTCSAPAPPYVTSGKTDLDRVRRMQDALLEAFEDPDLTASREALLLDKIKLSSAATYQPIFDDFKHNLSAV